MLNIGLITNFNIFEKAKAALSVADTLKKEDCRILVASFNKERLQRIHKDRDDFCYMPLDSVYHEADVIIVLGGDGSILEVARRAAQRNIPILGINLGRLGYMAELEVNELSYLHKLFTKDYHIEKRSMLKVEIFNGEELKSYCYALNDAVISNGSVSRIIDLELFADGNKVFNYRADGLIICTPTGSTAYSLSAGGAVIDPSVPCVGVTPICPHSLSARPLIFPNDTILEVKNISLREKNLYLTVDGKMNFELYRNQVVKISKSNMETELIRFKNQDFYQTLCKKMQDSNF